MEKSAKIEVVSEIKELFENSDAVYIVDYSGISVSEINEIRREFIKEDVKYKVLKNSLVKKAIDDIGGYEELDGLLNGMNGFAFAGENFVAPAKIIEKYSKDLDKFTMKGCYIDSEFYDASKLGVLASMPTKDEVMAGIARAVNSPAQDTVGAINAVMRDLASVVDEISKTKAA